MPMTKGGAMMPPSPRIKNPVPRRSLPRKPPVSQVELASRSDRPDVQEQIRRSIHEGTARVRPCPGDPGRVEIFPVRDTEG